MGKKSIWLILIMMFFLVSCQSQISSIEDIDNYIENFMSHSNQFNIDTTIDASITANGVETSLTEEIEMFIQIEPYYLTYVDEGMTYIEYMEDDLIKTASYDEMSQVEGKFLYTYLEYLPDNYTTYDIELDLKDNHYDIKKTRQGSYVIEANVRDLLSENDYELINAMMGSFHSTDDFIEDATAKAEIFLSRKEIRYIVTVNIDIDDYDIAVEVTMDLKIRYASFTTVDVSDTTLFFPISSGEGSAVIDVHEHILYPAHRTGAVSYDIYLEPGKYVFDILEEDFSGRRVHVNIYDKNTLESVLTFADVYSPTYDLYESSINTYFNINEVGYYEIFIEYPESNIPVISQLKEYEYDTDGTINHDLVVTESGTYYYNIEGPYDFFSIYIDIPGYTYVDITNSNGNKMYFTEYGEEEIYHTYSLHNTLSYLNHDPHNIYIFGDNAISGTVTIELEHLDTAGEIDFDTMPDMLTTFDIYLHTQSDFIDQYLKVEIISQGFYEFYYDIIEGYPLIKDALYTQNGELVTNINEGEIVPLSIGTYYYLVLGDNYDGYYGIRYDMTSKHIISNDLTTLNSIETLIGNLNDLNLIWDSITSKDDYIVYNFTLTEETDVVISNESEYQLYAASGEKISLNLYDATSYGVYRLDAGDYFVGVTLPKTFNTDNLPYEYHLLLGELNVPGSENDTSVYPYFEILEPRTWGNSMPDYLGDIDGYKIIVDKETTYAFTAYEWTTIFKGKQLIATFYNSDTITLEPGIYYVIGARNPEYNPWHLYYDIVA